MFRLNSSTGRAWGVWLQAPQLPRLWKVNCTLLRERFLIYNLFEGIAAQWGDMGDMTDRRTARRYDLSLPVIIRIPVDQDAHNGKTRDISTRGVYFVIEDRVTAGAELDLTMTLPAEVTGGTEVFIRAVGKVVRVEKAPEDGDRHVGVAALIQRYEIIRNESMKI
jgi:hypothetical protein